jgi:Raf kinase inhibitor-like YbhB/YbcL family protein
MAGQAFSLTSPAFQNGAPIPPGCTCDGTNASPPLQWRRPPHGTRSFALIVDDPDAPDGTFTHWVQFDIPASVSELSEGDDETGVSGRNDFHAVGYGGPCPPPNHGSHRYYFKLFAVDVESLDLPSGASRQEVEQSLQGHTLAQAQLMGQYQRGPDML